MQSSIEVRARKIVGLSTLLAVSCLALLAPSGAGAATVVNGDFETGTLNGWQVYTANPFSMTSSGWFPYAGTLAPLFSQEEREEAEGEGEFFASVQAPPQGTHAAISSESDPSLHILYQDVTLEPYYSHTLTLTAYYNSFAPIAVPTPDTLDPGIEAANQQYRIDVMKPTAPIDSVNPEDILATLFANKVGDSETMSPTTLTADLTPFAGQTVRLRFADVDNEYFFHAGVDAVSIVSTPPSNAFKFGALKINRKNGVARLQLLLPGSGKVVVQDSRSATGGPAQAASTGKRKLIKTKSVSVAKAGSVFVSLAPTAAARKILTSRHKLAIKARVSFTPTGGLALTKTFSGKLKLRP